MINGQTGAGQTGKGRYGNGRNGKRTKWVVALV